MVRGYGQLIPGALAYLFPRKVAEGSVQHAGALLKAKTFSPLSTVDGPLFRRTISRADEASPTPAAEDAALDRALLLLEPVSFGTKLVDLVEHPFQQRFSRNRRNPGSQKLSDFTALTMNLATPFAQSLAGHNQAA